MNNSSLIHILRSFSIPEINSFKRFLIYKFPKKRTEVRQLGEIIIKYLESSMTKKQISKTKVHLKIFGKLKYKDERIRQLMSSLKKIVDEFIIMEELDKHEYVKQRLLSSSYSDRLLKKEFDRLYRKRREKIKTSPPKDRFEYLEQYLLLEQFYYFPETDRRKLPSGFLQMTVDFLERFFVMAMMQLDIEMTSRNKLKEEKPAISYFKPFIKGYNRKLKENDFPLRYPLSEIQKFQETPKSSITENLILIFQENYTRYSPLDAKMICKILANQMIWLYRNGEKEYMNKAFILYQFGLEQNILTYDKSLSIMDYLNILTAAIGSKELDWAHNFLIKYSSKLPKKDLNIAKTLGIAMILLEQGKFKKVIDLLRINQFQKSILDYRRKFLLLKAYVKLVFQDRNKYHDYSMFMIKLKDKRKKHNRADYELKTEAFHNFIEACKRLVSFSVNSQPKQKYLNNIEKFIISTKRIEARNWLLQEVDFLKQRK